MHTHFPRLPSLALPIVFFQQFVSIHLHFYARLVARDFYYCHEYIKKTINHVGVIQSESETHLSCLLGALLLITHSGQDRHMNLRHTQPCLPPPAGWMQLGLSELVIPSICYFCCTNSSFMIFTYLCGGLTTKFLLL